MSFLDHLDELRKRLIRSALFIAVAFVVCWVFSGYIYNFLQVPVLAAMREGAGCQTVRPCSGCRQGPCSQVSDRRAIHPAGLRVLDTQSSSSVGSTIRLMFYNRVRPRAASVGHRHIGL